MQNFPQSFEPVGSDSILEQFVQFKNYVKEAMSQFESNVNEMLDSTDYVQTKVQNLTNEQKAQARENIGAGASTINVVDNLSSSSNFDALSANQGRILNEKIDSSVESLNQLILENVSDLEGDVSELNQEIGKTLKTPMNAPATTEIVGINVNNSQVGIGIGDLLQLTNGILNPKQSIKVLWETTSTNWAGTTITLNSSDYDFLIFIADFTNTILGKGKSGRLHFMNTGYYAKDDDTILKFSRILTRVSDTQYTITDCTLTYWRDSKISSNTDNHYLIPYKILGVKL